MAFENRTSIVRKDYTDAGGADVVDRPSAEVDPPPLTPVEPQPDEALRPAPEFRPPWTTALVAAGGCLVLLLLLFHQTAWSMVNTWMSSGSYGHAFLIVPLSAYLIWRRRFVVEPVMPMPMYVGLIPLAAACLAWTIGDLAGLQFVKQFALVGMVPAILLTVLGWEVVRRLAFPLFFLIFAVPFGDFLIAPLQDLTAVFSVRMLQWAGVPVYIDGLLIHIPTGSFIVAEACAGVRYLVVMGPLGFLGAHLFYNSWWRRALFITLAFAIPIVANGIRAFGIVYIAYVTDHEYAVGVDHLVYGGIFLGFVTLLVLAIGMSFREPRPAIPDHRIVDWTGVPDAPAGTGSRVVAAALTAIVVLAAAPVYSRHADTVAPAPAITADEPEVAGWAAADPLQPLWTPKFNGTDADVHASYASGTDRVDVYVAYYRQQRQHAEVTNTMNLLWPDRWSRIQGGRATVVIDGEPLSVQMARISERGRHRLVYWWYWVDDRYTAERIPAKVLELRSKLFGNVDAAATVAVSTPYDDNVKEAAARLARFVNDFKGQARYLETLADPSPGAARAP